MSNKISVQIQSFQARQAILIIRFNKTVDHYGCFTIFSIFLILLSARFNSFSRCKHSKFSSLLIALKLRFSSSKFTS